jgi:membrane-associated phospholipid phosphatase
VPTSILAAGHIKNDQDLIRSGYKSFMAQGLNIAATEILKRSFKKQRPCEAFPEQICLRQKTHGSSFPSGHTSNAFCLATSLTLSSKKWYVAVPAFTFAGIVAYSRMRLGAHYPGDVVMGIVVGVASSVLTWQVDRWASPKN